MIRLIGKGTKIQKIVYGVILLSYKTRKTRPLSLAADSEDVY